MNFFFQHNTELLNENNYDNQIKNILESYSNFSSYFFEVVEQNFTIEVCNNTNTDIPNDEKENNKWNEMIGRLLSEDRHGI